MCDGDGDLEVMFHDSRGYSVAGVKAYAGVSNTANGGMKINNLSKMEALNCLAKTFGMFTLQAVHKKEDSLGALIRQIQQRGSKAPISGQNTTHAPVEPDEGAID